MTRSNSTPLWRRILAGTCYFLLCGVAVLFGTAMGYVGQSSVMTAVTMQTIKRTTPQEIFSQKDSINLLLLGCDEDLSYGGKKVLKQNARSDMMLLAHLDFKANRITGVSIPRDLLLDMPGYRTMKINAYHTIGGPQLSQQAVEFLTGVSIDRVLVLNYKAFQEMVNLVGGVDVFVQKHLKYTDKAGGLFINIKPGRQHLNGYNAMCFVRYRHGDSDFLRQDRQKEFLMAFKDSLMTKPGLLPKVVEKSRTVLGDSLTPDELAAIALFARKVGNENVKMGQIPVIEGDRYDLFVDRSGTQDILRKFHFLDDEPRIVGQQ